jgi:hypothetical protein
MFGELGFRRRQSLWCELSVVLLEYIYLCNMLVLILRCDCTIMDKFTLLHNSSGVARQCDNHRFFGVLLILALLYYLHSWTPLYVGTNFPYWSSRIGCYLEALDLDIWRVTYDRTKHLKDHENQTMSDKNKFILMWDLKIYLFETFRINFFNQVFTPNKRK